MSTYPQKGMQRILAGSTNPQLRARLRNQDGGAFTVAGTPTVTCTITRADGTVVVTDRSAAVTPDGSLTVNLTSVEGQTLDVLTAVWKVDTVERATSHHRIVGGFLFSVDDVQAAGGVSKFNATTLLRARDATLDMIERATGVCWSPTFDRYEFQGQRRHTLASKFRPLRRIRTLTLDDAPQNISLLDVNAEAGLIYSDTTLCGWTVLAVEHGFDDAPEDLVEAGIQACKFTLLQSQSALGQRVRSVSDDQGTRTFSFAGKDHPTGIDDIDAVIMGYDMRDPY
jgi:hypothetical protein